MKKLFPTFVSAIVLTAALACSAVAEPVTRSLSVAPRSSYEPAAARGDARAQTALGLKYSEIRDQQADAIAYKWFLRAANQGNAEAQLLLSGMAAGGRGTEQSNVEAYKWAVLAGQSAEPDIVSSASTIVGVLNRQMTAEEINTARRHAGEFKPKAEFVHTAAMQLSSKESKPTAAPSRTDITARNDAPAQAKVAPVQPPKLEAPVPVAVAKAEAPAKPQTPVVAKVEPAPVVTAPVPQARTEAKAETKTEPVTVARVETPKVETPKVAPAPAIVPTPVAAPAPAAEQPAAAAPAQTTPAAAPAQTTATPANATNKTAKKSSGKSRHAGKQSSRHHRGNYGQWVGVASSYARAYGAYGW